MSCTEIELKALKANELIAKAVSLVENAQKMVGEIPLSEMKTVRSNDTGLKWTGDIVNLVEMVYGLVEMGCVNEGNVPIEKLGHYCPVKILGLEINRVGHHLLGRY